MADSCELDQSGHPDEGALGREPSSRRPHRLRFILAAVPVGIVAGLLSVGLDRSLTWARETLWATRAHWWAVILPALGCGVAVLLKHWVFGQSTREGVPRIIESVCRESGVLRLRTVFTPLIYCFLALGGGGSAGPEGPVAISGAAVGSNTSRVFNLNAPFRVTLVGCGAAAAIAAIFKAPLTGMMFATEIVLGEWMPFTLVPIAVASMVGAETSKILTGARPVFRADYMGFEAMDIPAMLFLLLLAVAVSVLLTRFIWRVESSFDKYLTRGWVRAALGGLAVGTLGLYSPLILGEGYMLIRQAISGSFEAGLAVAGLTLAAKLAATIITLGSGAPGGVFAPCLVLGSLSGLFSHRLFVSLLPGSITGGEADYALLGMAGVVGGMMQAPLTAVFLVVEITGGYRLLMPVLFIAFAGSVISHYLEPASFYYRELVRSGDLLRPKTDARLLADLKLEDLMDAHRPSVSPDMTVAKFMAFLRGRRETHFPVVDHETQRYVGLVGVSRMRSDLLDPDKADKPLSELIKGQDVPRVEPGESIPDVLEKMEKSGREVLPVLGKDGHLLGLVGKKQLMSGYRHMMKERDELEQSF